MRRLALALLAGTSLLGLASAASAADLAVRKAPPPPPPPPVWSWSGFYIGAHVGGAWSTVETTSSTSLPGGGTPPRHPALVAQPERVPRRRAGRLQLAGRRDRARRRGPVELDRPGRHRALPDPPPLLDPDRLDRHVGRPHRRHRRQGTALRQGRHRLVREHLQRESQHPLVSTTSSRPRSATRAPGRCSGPASSMPSLRTGLRRSSTTTSTSTSRDTCSRSAVWIAPLGHLGRRGHRSETAPGQGRRQLPLRLGPRQRSGDGEILIGESPIIPCTPNGRPKPPARLGSIYCQADTRLS